jgi:hypothetical protein
LRFDLVPSSLRLSQLPARFPPLVPQEHRRSIQLIDEKIEVTVAVIVAPGRARRESVIADPGPLGDLLERPIAPIAEEAVRAKAGDVEVVPAVVVVIGDRDSHCPARIGEARRVRHLAERAIPEILVEGCLGTRLSCEGSLDRRGVEQVEVEPSIPIEIEHGDSPAHALDDVLLLGGRLVEEGEAGFARDLD